MKPNLPDARKCIDIGRVARNSLSATIENTDNDLMRPMVLVASLVLLGACTTSDDPGYSIRNIRCDSDLAGEEAVYDYAEDAVGHETIAEAIEALRAEDSTWQLRDDWHALTLGDTSASPVEFTDDRGWVYLSVDLTQLNDSWVVNGYTTCSPQGS